MEAPKPRTPQARDQSQNPQGRNDFDEATAYDSYMNLGPGFQYGPICTVGTTRMTTWCLFVTSKSSPPLGRRRLRKKYQLSVFDLETTGCFGCYEHFYFHFHMRSLACA